MLIACKQTALSQITAVLLEALQAARRSLAGKAKCSAKERDARHPGSHGDPRIIAATSVLEFKRFLLFFLKGRLHGGL